MRKIIIAPDSFKGHSVFHTGLPGNPGRCAGGVPHVRGAFRPIADGGEAAWTAC